MGEKNKHMKVILAFLTMMVFGNNTKSQIIAPTSDIRKIITISDSNYWSKVSAIDFVDTLISYGGNYIFLIEIYPSKCWYNDSCIAKLKRLRKKRVYSASVITHAAEEYGEYFCGLTTISQEIDLLIEGIKEKHYPERRSSSCFYHPRKY